jgi:hypothetical protein
LEKLLQLGVVLVQKVSQMEIRGEIQRISLTVGVKPQSDATFTTRETCERS